MDRDAVIQELIRCSISAVQPEHFIPELISLRDDVIHIGDAQFSPDDFEHLYIAAIGKAAVGMAEAVDRLIHPYISEGVILTKHIPDETSLGEKYLILQGGHPVPTAESVQGAEAILRLLSKAGRNDLVLFLISGGGSALMTKPLGEITLESFQAFSRSVLSCGADINEFNILRKHLDRVKGGRLAQIAAPARMISVILSDVVGSPLDIIASGPTVPDRSTFSDALEILEKYEGKTAFPPKIRETLIRGCRGEISETPKADDPLFTRSDVFLAADNRRAAYAAEKRGRELGFHSRVINTRLTGEASAIGAWLPSFFSELEAPGLLIFGGETTVTLQGNGLGGRNTELALASVRPMADWPGCALVTLATDGEDGPTNAAGAIVSADTLPRALGNGCIPEDFLRDNDSWHFFDKTGGLLSPGPSGTNVNDLTFLIKFE